jgi:hypothetical protein
MSGTRMTKPPTLIRAKELMHHPTTMCPCCLDCNEVHDPDCKPMGSDSQPYSVTPALDRFERARTQLIIVDKQARRLCVHSSGNKGWDKRLCVSHPGHLPLPPMTVYRLGPSTLYNRVPLRDGPVPHPQVCHQTSPSNDQTVSQGIESIQQAPQQTRLLPITPQCQTFTPPMPQPFYAPQPRYTKLRERRCYVASHSAM